MSFLIIILAILVAISLFVFLAGAATASQSTADTVQNIDWSVAQDAEFQSYMPHKKINAIKRYRELTNVGLKEAKEAVDYMVAHPNEKKGKHGLVANTGGAGVRDLLLDGKIDEAIDVYAAFMGVDEFTARDAIRDLQRDLTAESNLADIDYDELQDLVANGKKIDAIKRYMAQSGAGLKDAKTFIETEI